MYPLGPVIGGAGLNITVMSLNGEFGIGIIACPDLLPDLWGMADEFPEAAQRTAGMRRSQRESVDPSASSDA